MPERQVDPARLQGDALSRWYLRSPDDIESERQAADAQRYDAFFGAEDRPNPDPGFRRDFEGSGRDIDPGFGRQLPPSARNVDPGFSTVPPGFYPWQPDPAAPGKPAQQSDDSGLGASGGAILDRGLAGPDDGGEFIDIGNPQNPRLRGEWERANSKPWPRTSDGRRFHVSHKVAIADGGTNTLENIEPMHPEEHIAHHMRNGDFRRWGMRAVPRAAPGGGFRGGGVVMRGLGVLSILPTITGVLSGRIKLGNDPVTNAYHLFGYPAPDEAPKEPLIA